MINEELYRRYRKVHDAMQDANKSDCKLGCGMMEFVTVDTVYHGDAVSPNYRIDAGVSCFGRGRWETIGEGDSWTDAVAEANAYLDEVESRQATGGGIDPNDGG